MSPCACHQNEKRREIKGQSRSAERTSGAALAHQEQGPKVGQLAAMERAANQGTGVRRAAQLREALNAPVQRRNTEAATGLGENLQAGLEQLSGMDLSGVRVHYNSPKPTQLQALAYTQGKDIHVAPGQEKHLPHEGWHVVQQMQGRVQPTMELAGSAINDSPALEKEADVMGARAMQRKAQP